MFCEFLCNFRPMENFYIIFLNLQHCCNNRMLQVTEEYECSLKLQ